jgi:Ca2+-binding RTX toxin-like protein
MALPKVLGTTDDDADLSAAVSSSIFGMSGNDKIAGSNQSDQIFAGDSTWRDDGLNPNYQGESYKYVGDNDTVDAGEGDDVVYVGTGTDEIDGGAGVDQLNFYAGAFGTFYVEAPGDGQGDPPPKFVEKAGWLANVKVDLIAGTYLGQFIDNGEVVGKSSGTFKGFEAVLGSLGRDTILGSNQNDQFKPIKGNDSVNGRGGFDILSYADLGTLGVVLTWGTGKVRDTFGDTDSFSNIEQVIGSKNNDDMTGTVGGQIFTGGAGKDTIDGVGGTDTIDYSLETGGKAINVLLAKHEATDTFGSTDTLDNIETVIGTFGRDVMSGDGGANTFWGRDGKDNLGGGAGKDTLWGGLQNDALGGGDGNDKLYGEAGSDVLIGNDGDDILDGGDARDTLKGGDGDDLIEGGDGNDLIDDKVSDAVSHKDKVWRGNTINGGNGNDEMKGLGVVSGGEGDDSITGQGRLRGDAGNDTIKGALYEKEHPYIKATEMSGGDGNDTLIGGPILVQATASYDYSGTGIVAHMDTGKVTVTSTDTDTLVDIFALTGSRLDDTVFGTGDSDFIRGSEGNDTITGKGGNDTIGGDAGDDSIDGGKGNDIVSGGDGNDTLRGGSGGHVEMSGGNGDDTFYMVALGLYYGGEDDDVFYGGGGADGGGVAIGGGGFDTLIVDAGKKANGDLGAGRDLFVLDRDAVRMDISNFKSKQDQVDLSDFGLSSFNALMKLGNVVKTNSGNNLTFQLDADTQLVFHDTPKSAVHAIDFIL